VRFGMNESACSQARGLCEFFAGKGCFMNRTEARKIMGKGEHEHEDGCHVRFGTNETACSQSRGLCAFYAGRGCFMNRSDSGIGGLEPTRGCHEGMCNQSRGMTNISMDATSSAFSAHQWSVVCRLSQILLVVFAVASICRN